MDTDIPIGYIACWKLSPNGRCRKENGHKGECVGVPYEGYDLIYEVWSGDAGDDFVTVCSQVEHMKALSESRNWTLVGKFDSWSLALDALKKNRRRR